ncbi:hypothetical protein OHT93_37755 [Streptomyces sp. NBC_00191]|uniref:hypothetical protein n=1 Tax=Streptomyces sp. NBC_00191 TaxID=2975674 RepID=UPI00324962F8
MTPRSLPGQQPGVPPSKPGRKLGPIADGVGAAHRAWLEPLRTRFLASGLTISDLALHGGWSKSKVSELLLAGAATALREDQHAVAQGIATPYNSWVNEGRITDVKLQKRIMAGRAGVPLLRHRVILIAHLRRRYADRIPTASR